jgi:hypothetical protein
MTQNDQLHDSLVQTSGTATNDTKRPAAHVWSKPLAQPQMTQNDQLHDSLVQTSGTATFHIISHTSVTAWLREAGRTHNFSIEGEGGLTLRLYITCLILKIML